MKSTAAQSAPGMELATLDTADCRSHTEPIKNDQTPHAVTAVSL